MGIRLGLYSNRLIEVVGGCWGCIGVACGCWGCIGVAGGCSAGWVVASGCWDNVGVVEGRVVDCLTQVVVLFLDIGSTSLTVMNLVGQDET